MSFSPQDGHEEETVRRPDRGRSPPPPPAALPVWMSVSEGKESEEENIKETEDEREDEATS